MKSIREWDSQPCTEFQTHVTFPFSVQVATAGCLMKRLLIITWMNSQIKVPVWWQGCSSRQGEIPKGLRSAPKALRWRIIPPWPWSALLLTLCIQHGFELRSPPLKHLFTSHWRLLSPDGYPNVPYYKLNSVLPLCRCVPQPSLPHYQPWIFPVTLSGWCKHTFQTSGGKWH